VKQTSTTSGTVMNGNSQMFSVGGRVLILLTLLLAVTPWTEYLWHFDNFIACSSSHCADIAR
jgi:hypothetical protein